MNEKKSLFYFLQLGVLEGVFVLLLLFIIFATLVATNVIHLSSFPSLLRQKTPAPSAHQAKTYPNNDPFTKSYDAQKAQKLLYNFLSQDVKPEYVPPASTPVEQNFLVSNGVITQANEFQMKWDIPNDPSQFKSYLDYMKGSNQIQREIVYITVPFNVANKANIQQIQQNLLLKYFTTIKGTTPCSEFKQPYSYCVITTSTKNPFIQTGTYFDNKNIILFSCMRHTDESTITADRCVDL